MSSCTSHSSPPLTFTFFVSHPLSLLISRLRGLWVEGRPIQGLKWRFLLYSNKNIRMPFFWS